MVVCLAEGLILVYRSLLFFISNVTSWFITYLNLERIWKGDRKKREGDWELFLIMTRIRKLRLNIKIFNMFKLKSAHIVFLFIQNKKIHFFKEKKLSSVNFNFASKKKKKKGTINHIFSFFPPFSFIFTLFFKYSFFQRFLINILIPLHKLSTPASSCTVYWHFKIYVTWSGNISCFHPKTAS